MEFSGSRFLAVPRLRLRVCLFCMFQQGVLKIWKVGPSLTAGEIEPPDKSHSASWGTTCHYSVVA